MNPTSKPHIKPILRRHHTSQRLQINGYQRDTEKDFLRIYFPKYYSQLSIDVSTNPIVSKIKLIKLTKDFKGAFKATQSKLLWRLLLANKRRSLKSVPILESLNKYPESPQNSPLIKARDLLFFNNVRSFGVAEPLENRLINLDYIGNHDLLSMSWKQMSKYIHYKKDLQDLSLNFPKKQGPEASNMLMKLDRMGVFLRNLKNLRLDIHNTKCWDYSALFTRKKVCEAMTSLKFQEYVRSSLMNKLGLLSESCKNLQVLSIKFKKLKRDRFSGPMRAQLDRSLSEFLGSLKDFKKLASLEITWDQDLKMLLKDFSVPEGLKNFKLIFMRRSWEEIFDGQLLKTEVQEGRRNPFESHAECLEFYNSWRRLTQLESLELHFTQFRGEASFIKYFVTPLLAAVPKLNSLKYFYSSPKKSIRSPQRINNEAFSSEFEAYSPFLMSSNLDNLYLTLQKLKIKILLSDQTPVKINDIDLLQKFSNLKSLKIKGNVLSEVNSKDLVKLVQSSLKLDKLLISSCETLKAMLRTLYQFKRANGLNIKLKVTLKPDNGCTALGILEAFCSFMKSVNNISGLRITFLYNDLGDDCEFYQNLVELVGKYPEVNEFQVYKTSAFGGFDNFILKNGNIIFHYRTDLF